MPGTTPSHAMVLAAGLGKRMRAVSGTLPKPLVPVAGKALIDHALDRLAVAGVSTIVVNSHYQAERLEAHVKAYARRNAELDIQISREDTLLETGGGVAHALGRLGKRAFYVHNSDVMLSDGPKPALASLAAGWREGKMDALLLVCPLERAFGHSDGADFSLGPDGQLERAPDDPSGFVFTGVQLLHPRLFAQAPEGAYSLNRHYDEALAEGRLFGHVHEGAWFHVGSPEGLAAAEAGLTGATAR